MNKKCLSALLICLCAFSTLGAKSRGRDSLAVFSSSEASLCATNGYSPLWSYSQNWGRYSTSKVAEVIAYNKADWRFLKSSWAELHLGGAVQASTNRSNCMFHEAYLKGRIWKIDGSLGMVASTPISQQGGLGTGSYLMSDNARPIPKAAAGFYKWTSIPYLGDYLQVRGGASLGYIPDFFYRYEPNSSSYTSNVIQHEKFMYVRAGHWMVKPYAGLIHSALMGGTLPDGTKIPVDFISTSLAKGSSSMGESGFGGEESNAAGAHQGMWELGTDLVTSGLDASFYYRRPFADSRARGLFNFARCKDFTLGMDLKPRNFAPITEICVEFMTTLWQGGEGLPDACFVTESGETVLLAWTQMTPENIHAYFKEDVISSWEAVHGQLTDTRSCRAFLEHFTNHDQAFGGRTDYMSNYLYQQGWSVGNLSNGSAMFLTDSMLSSFPGMGGFTNRYPNVRMRTLCIGATGRILPQLHYKAKFSVSSNQGSYREKYEYWSWNLNANDCFSKPLTQFNTGIWLGYHARGISYFFSAFCDWGQMYNTASCRIGMAYSL